MSIEIEKIFLSNEFTPYQKENTKTSNTDVVVYLSSGEKYVASFFSYDNIDLLKLKHQQTGEYLNGKYFQVENMVLVDDCSNTNIKKVVEYLLEEGDFKTVFKLITA